MKLGNDIAAIVTGGASGLGEASARGLAEAGCKVALLDLNEARGNTVAEEIGGVFVTCDVTDPMSIASALATARGAHGQERICVNCAGIVAGHKTVSHDKATGTAQAHDLDVFSRVIDVNLIGTFRVAALSSTGMASLEPVNGDGARGVVIMTSSIAAEDGQMGQAAYAASKGGVAGMTLPMARDLARDGIRAVSIMPGLFHTPMFDSLSEEVRQSLAAGVPHPQRLGDPAEYAALVRHICENDMLNGTSIRLDGALRLAPR